MTALDERPVQATATPDDIAAYLSASRPYARQHPGNGNGAIRAGLDAVLANQTRRPTSTVQAGLKVTADPHEAGNLHHAGWITVGLGQHRLTGDILYVLERAERAAADGAS